MKQCKHSGPMPQAFLTRPVHVAETDEKARTEAEPLILEADSLGSRDIVQTRIGFRGNTDTATRSDRARGSAEQRNSYDWRIENGLAIVGSPETVRRKLEKDLKVFGYDVFCANHQIGTMPFDQVSSSLKLFGEEVIPAFS